MKRHVLLTGSPGVGKTTLCKKVAERLQQVDGFYTEEIRNEDGIRKGFDVISLPDPNVRKSLAIANAPPALKGPKVGKYTVIVEDFESVALPCMSNIKSKVLVIDEIGKMEVFSKKFPQLVKNVFRMKDLHILATIPSKVGPGPLGTLLEELKNNEDAKLIEVTKANRDDIISEILPILEA